MVANTRPHEKYRLKQIDASLWEVQKAYMRYSPWPVGPVKEWGPPYIFTDRKDAENWIKHDAADYEHFDVEGHPIK